MIELYGTPVADTFAEAFPMTCARLLITADSPHWAEIAGRECTGYATSVIACDAEAAVERVVSADETPDGRPGLSVLMFAFNRDALESAVVGRIGQCVLTCPTTACYDGFSDDADFPGVGDKDADSGENEPRDKRIKVGDQLRFFGDTYQSSRVLGRRRFWRVPVMDGEFVCEDRFFVRKGVGGGNLLICGKQPAGTLAAAETAVQAAMSTGHVICPFPGGVVRSGSKVGSHYRQLKASTNDDFCPTLRAYHKDNVELPSDAAAVYEVVIDGTSVAAVAGAMKAALHAAARQPGIALITAGNYGGKLGPHHFRLKDLLSSENESVGSDGT